MPDRERADGEKERRIVDAPLTSPAPEAGLWDVFRHRYLLRLLIRREIDARYQGSFLGMLWSYINPLSLFILYWAIIGGVIGLHENVPNYGIHLFSGLVIVTFFTETFNAGTRAIVANRPLVQKMAVPREMFPVASMLVSLYHVGPQLVILVIACALQGWYPDPVGLLTFVIALAMMIVLGIAAALLFSAANVYFRDFGKIVGVLSNFVRFSVPMIYPFAMVADRFGDFAPYYLFNPLSEAVLLFQRTFWLGTLDEKQQGTPAATDLPTHLVERGLIFIAIGLVLLWGAQWVFRQLDNGIPERL